MTEERLDRHIYQYVEAELRNYKTYQRLIAEFDKELLYSGAKSGLSKDPSGRFSQGQTSDSTHNEAARVIANEARIFRAVDMCRCIDEVLYDMSDHDRRLIELKYFQNLLTDNGIMRELHLGRMTYYRHKRGLIKKFALRMRLL